MTLNGKIALILRYFTFTEFDRFGHRLRHSRLKIGKENLPKFAASKFLTLHLSLSLLLAYLLFSLLLCFVSLYQ